MDMVKEKCNCGQALGCIGCKQKPHQSRCEAETTKLKQNPLMTESMVVLVTIELAEEKVEMIYLETK